MMAFLRLQGVGVDFPLYQGGSRSLKKAILSASSRGNVARDAHERITVHALSDLSLRIEGGQRVGLLGTNGAGKTTLLRVLAGIFEPTRGRIRLGGRISALLNVSVGLNFDATGRENILLRGLYMGMQLNKMREHVDEIIEFAELGDHIDMPVRTYSSGMMVRLAFAISTCVPPEILLMDEWLSAGDARFLTKAKNRMTSFVSRSDILVLASHSMELLLEWCHSGILLDHGQIVSMGPIADVVAAYRASIEAT
jgi:ABC-type polysaccharide/polyol phosphate transport system ATPase subunit